jgi:hypothetical protein
VLLDVFEQHRYIAFRIGSGATKGVVSLCNIPDGGFGHTIGLIE